MKRSLMLIASGVVSLLIIVAIFTFISRGTATPAQVSPTEVSPTEVRPTEVSTAEVQGEPFAPVPAAAYDPAVTLTNGYYVAEIKDGIYWITDGLYQMMFLTTGEGVIVVDAPPSIGQNILNAIASVTDEPITHVIYSHTHVDHIGGAGLYPDDAIIIAHEDTAAHLATKNDPNRPVPTETFPDTLTLNVGTQTLTLDYHGVNHEPGNIFIYAPEQKVLMVVDIVFPGWTPFPDLAIADDIEGFLKSHDVILEYDFDTYLGGHLTRLGTREDVETQKAYFMDIVAAAGEANMAMNPGSAFAEAQSRNGTNNPWAVVKILFDGVAQQCADTVEPKWSERLGGVDIFTFDHCWTIAEYQRVD